MSDSAEALLKQAAGTTVSPETVGSVNVPDLSDQIEKGLGVSTEDVTASQVLLVTMLIDDSSSIRHHNNTGAVRSGYNTVIDALQASKQRDAVLAHTRYLNGGVFYDFRPIDETPRMDQTNYKPSGRTPLYEESVNLLGTVAAQIEKFANAGVMARSITLIVTDGDDNESANSVGDVKNWVDDLLAKEMSIIVGMGIDDGRTDYRAVFGDMGIADDRILTPGNTESEIRDAFGVFSRSAVQASQGTAQFDGDVGGFGV